MVNPLKIINAPLQVYDILVLTVYFKFHNFAIQMIHISFLDLYNYICNKKLSLEKKMKIKSLLTLH